MDRLTNFVLRHRRWVYAFWAVMLVSGVGLAGLTTNRLTFDFSLPGQPGWETDEQIQQTFGNGGGNTPYIPVVTVPAGSTVEQQKDTIAGVFAAVQKQLPETRVVDYAATGDKAFVTQDGRSTYALVYPPTATGFQLVTEPKLRKVLEAEGQKAGLATGITSYDLLSAGDSSDNGPSVLVETLIGAFGALLVLAFVFASFLALVPLAIAAVSILSTFIAVLLLTTITDVSFVVQFLISLVGLGVAIDYSLLLVSRWREERAHGRDNHDAVREAVRTAGHAVIASGVTVAISLLALVAVPVPFLRSMGLGGMLIPLVSTAVVLTLLPAILGGIGPRVDWPRVRRENVASRGWTAWSRMIVRFRVPAAVLALAALTLLILPLFGIKIGLSQTDSLAKSGPAYDTLQTLERGGVPTGVLTPVEILVKGGSPDSVADKAKSVDGVATAFAPDAAQWRKGESALVNAIPRDETVDQDGATIVQRIDDALAGEKGVVGEAGTGAVVLDYINAVFKKFPIVLGLIALVTYVLLVRTFRSVLLPLKAVLLNIVSVAAVFGATVWFWQEGHGSEAVFDISATGAVTFWLPILIFAFLFGLSMDYEVFILARMREEYDRGGTTKGAIVEGLGRTGRLVTSAALILFLSFVALSSSPGTDIKVFATALGVGILLDATIVRAVLVPALVALFGSWNWYLPDWVARVLRIETSHAHAEVPSPRGELADRPVGSRRV